MQLNRPVKMVPEPSKKSAPKTKSVAFEIGRISHYHNPAAMEVIDLTVTLQFDHPVLDRQVFSFSLECHNHPDGKDTISFKKPAVSYSSFVHNGRIYALQLIGFGKNSRAAAASTPIHQAIHSTDKLFAEFIDITSGSDVFATSIAVPFSILGLIAVQKPQ